LAVLGVRTRDADIGSEIEFMTHVPGVAMRNGNKWLREFLRPRERINLARTQLECVSA
jgi:hypothetical protein